MNETVLQKTKRQFASLQLEVRSALEACQVKLNDVHQFLVSFFQSECNIPEATDLTKLFNSITRAKLWRYDHYSPLKELTETFLPDDNPAKKLVTHSLLFCPILFCRIPINLIGFFSMHAKRFSDFHKKKISTKIDRQNELKS